MCSTPRQYGSGDMFTSNETPEVIKHLKVVTLFIVLSLLLKTKVLTTFHDD